MTREQEEGVSMGHGPHGPLRAGPSVSELFTKGRAEPLPLSDASSGLGSLAARVATALTGESTATPEGCLLCSVDFVLPPFPLGRRYTSWKL